jgi:alpha-L-fucosidase
MLVDPKERNIMNKKIKHSGHRMSAKLVLLLGAGLLSSCSSNRVSSEGNSTIDPASKLEWFHNAKFGLFVHWGLYSIPARGEWVQYQESIPGQEYEKYARQFNPVKYNPAEWVSMAKDAGMKYVVITTKHHDGFCLFDSALTDYDSVDAAPYGKDPMKTLAEECKKQGVKLCFYYSVKDWHHPEFPLKYTYHNKKHPDGFHGFPNPDADYKKYFAYLKGQVKELLTKYGDVGIIWWDWSGSAFSPDETENRKMAQDLVDSIHQWQPGCLINNRMGGIGSDYGTPEQMIPGSKQGTAFEVCMTLNNAWGYSKNDTDYKSAETVVRNLVDIASKGGNYLLNVGPTPEGVMPAEAQRILSEVGAWLAVNGESIYGTTSGGPGVRWNPDIDAITAKDNTLYLHLFKWPQDNKVYLNDFISEFDNAYLLADKKKEPLKVDVHTQGLTIHLPENPVDAVDTVIVIRYKGDYVDFLNG